MNVCTCVQILSQPEDQRTVPCLELKETCSMMTHLCHRMCLKSEMVGVLFGGYTFGGVHPPCIYLSAM